MSARHYGRRPMTQRQRLEAAIEAAVAALDLLDGEADAEADSDGEADEAEPSLCPVSMDRHLAETLRP